LVELIVRKINDQKLYVVIFGLQSASGRYWRGRMSEKSGDGFLVRSIGEIHLNWQKPGRTSRAYSHIPLFVRYPLAKVSVPSKTTPDLVLLSLTTTRSCPLHSFVFDDLKE
jgi:hypothetical protein